MVRLLTTIAFLLLQVPGTTPVVQPQSPQQTISVDVDLVNVLFTVADRRGKLITTQQKEHFRVFEDNRLQTITNFSSETDLPLTVALLIDTSGSIRDKLRFEQEAAIQFFSSTLRPGKDRGLLITFDSGVDLLQDYTDDADLLARATEKMRAGGGTAMYDAVFLAVTEKLANQPGRKVVILISDGDDNSSRLSLTETLEAAQKSDTAIYCISTNATGGPANERGDRVMRRMADETGGRIFSPFKLSDLSVSFRGIGEELRSQYSLAYLPTNDRRDGRFRTIRIETTDKQLRVRARTGDDGPRGN